MPDIPMTRRYTPMGTIFCGTRAFWAPVSGRVTVDHYALRVNSYQYRQMPAARVSIALQAFTEPEEVEGSQTQETCSQWKRRLGHATSASQRYHPRLGLMHHANMLSRRGWRSRLHLMVQPERQRRRPRPKFVF